MSDLPTIVETLKLDPPVYLRKVDKAGYWNLPSEKSGTAPEDPVAYAVDNIFSDREPEHSIFLIRNDDDLRRIAIAYNANRVSLHQKLLFLVLKPEELQECGIEIKPTPGDLICNYANKLHADATGSRASWYQLCQQALNNSRILARCSKSNMKAAEASAREEGCTIIEENETCSVEECISEEGFEFPDHSQSSS